MGLLRLSGHGAYLPGASTHAACQGLQITLPGWLPLPPPLKSRIERAAGKSLVCVCAVGAVCGVFRGVRAVESNAEAHLGLLLCWAEHWEAQHMPWWLCPFSTLMSPAQNPILDVGIFSQCQLAGSLSG